VKAPEKWGGGEFVHGGVKVYRGAAGAARTYLEADRTREDDYYLTEGTGIAGRYAATRVGRVVELAAMDGRAYEAWVAGCDPDTGEPRGRLRTDEHAVRFLEVVVNGPKSWSLAAELHPDVAAAYEAAQDRAATEIIGWLAQHATTRVGPRGGQVAVPLDDLEAAVVRHYTSRAGDPHRHLHLQVNARVFAAGRWRGIDTVAVRDSIAAINGIGHAAVACDPAFRAALAGHGYTLDEAGEITQLAPYVGPFSRRAAQIGRHIDRYEAQWSAVHPGEPPGPALCRSWDARAWAENRPDKVTPRPGAELHRRWLDELARLGYRDRARPSHSWRPWWGGWTATRPPPRCWPGSVPPGPRGTPQTSAARSSSCSPARASSRTGPCAASWPRTSPPEHWHCACPCWPGPAYPTTCGR